MANLVTLFVHHLQKYRKKYSSSSLLLLYIKGDDTDSLLLLLISNKFIATCDLVNRFPLDFKITEGVGGVGGMGGVGE